MRKILIVIVFIFITSTLINSHSGRTDSYGGHNNRKTGGYHYHGLKTSVSSIQKIQINNKNIVTPKKNYEIIIQVLR